jgi:hypothetical protein
MDKNELYKLLEADIETLEDGYKYYWVKGKGALSASQLRAIADMLDELNKDWNDKVNEYFAHEAEKARD